VEDNLIDDAERFWIEYFRSWDRDFGYNLESGGCSNKTLSFKTKFKISETKKKIQDLEMLRNYK